MEVLDRLLKDISLAFGSVLKTLCVQAEIQRKQFTRDSVKYQYRKCRWCKNVR